MHLNKRSLISLSILVLILLSATVIPALAAPTTLWVPCANNGQGEIVPMDSNVQSSFATIVSPDGITYNRGLFTRRMGSGVGATTGDMYSGGGTAVVKNYANEGPWGPAGTVAFVQDTWKLESDKITATMTYVYMKDQNGVVQMDATNWVCTPK